MLRARSLEERYWIFAGAILALAAFNLTYRLGHEIVTEWDESLYALSAWETLATGHWLGRQLLGAVDYYNTKPPLNVWLIAGAFKVLGTNLVALRVTSAISAWLAVLTLQMWARRIAGPIAALVSSLALASMFGALHTHSGRSGNPDALLALLILLTAVVLEMSWRRPWRYVWLGPICAGVFLLKGLAVLMPLAIVAVVELWQLRRRPMDWRPRAAAVVAFLVPAGAWCVARWRFDQWRFLGKMVTYDFLGSVFQPLEGHDKWLTYYVWVLEKDHIDWMIAALVLWLAMPGRRDAVRRIASTWRRGTPAQAAALAWGAVTFLVPTVMQTKLPWYLNPFYPAFALGVGWLAARALESRGASIRPLRRAVPAAMIAIALVAAEGRFLWYSLHNRDLASSEQGLLLANRGQLAGHRVYLEQWNLANVFVIKAFIGAQDGYLGESDTFTAKSQPGDYLLASHEWTAPDMKLIGRAPDGHRLYQRCE